MGRVYHSTEHLKYIFFSINSATSLLKLEMFEKMLKKVKACLLSRGKAASKDVPTLCLCITTFLISIPLIVAITIRFHISGSGHAQLYIDTQDEALYTVDDKFLSLGLDSTVITEGFKHFNVSDPKLIQMIKYLSPAYLRIGGNQADQLIFSRDQSNVIKQTDNSRSYVLHASDWLKLCNLAKEANINIIYDLNSLLRNDNGSWNSDNAIDMINFSNENELSLDWELGNEPNSYPHKFDAYVNATQLGLDYHTLRDILNSFELYKNSLLVGPSTTRLRTKEIEEYLHDFLESGIEAVSAITFHHYYFSGQNATWADFLDIKNFNYLEECIGIVNSVVAPFASKLKPLWLGETSSAWHGGAPNLSDRFIGSFLWLDKLGLSAKLKIDVVVRQSVFKDNYALINNSYDPNPDWWVSLLYKMLVGPEVITTQFEGDETMRLYAHCAKPNALWDNSATVLVFGINLSTKNGYVNVRELHSDKKVFSYVLNSDNLFSQYVNLNGKTLELKKDLSLPEIKPNVIERSTNLEMPPHSLVFWVFTNTNLEACRKN